MFLARPKNKILRGIYTGRRLRKIKCSVNQTYEKKMVRNLPRQNIQLIKECFLKKGNLNINNYRMFEKKNTEKILKITKRRT